MEGLNIGLDTDERKTSDLENRSEKNYTEWSTLFEGETDKSTTIVRDMNVHFSVIDKEANEKKMVKL